MKGISSRWSFFQRTIPNIAHLFLPLESVIRQKLIPALLGREISDIERRLLSLPVRYGGLALPNPVLTAEREYMHSTRITDCLASLIENQQNDLNEIDTAQESRLKLQMKKDKESFLVREQQEVFLELSQPTKRAAELASEKGASSWLTCLPIRSLGYCLNKHEFRDALSLRYGWPIPNIPKHCACGQSNDIDHLLCCKKGGYVSLRHNSLRDLFVKLLGVFCKDVQTEPALIPVRTQTAEGDVGIGDAARLDVSARGIWNTFEKTFLDIRVTHANAPSQRHKSTSAIFTAHESEKKRKYLDRVLNVEKAAFVPVVLSTSGGYAPEAARLVKQIATQIAVKNKERYDDVMGHVRTRVRFTLLKATLASVRGFRGTMPVQDEVRDGAIMFNIIPNMPGYDPV